MTYYLSTWNSWNDSNYSCSTTTSTWGNWMSYSDQGTSASTGNVWTTWTIKTSDTTTDGTTWNNWIYEQPIIQEVKQLTPEEVKKNEEERIRMEELARKRFEEEENRKRIAEEKALQLLLENLEENQAEIFKKTGAIPVVAKSGRRYSIRKGTAGNVDELGAPIGKNRLCFHPEDWNIPVYDVMLAQKLALEICEDEARKIANFS